MANDFDSTIGSRMGMGGYSPSQERAAQMSEEDKEIAAFLLESQPKIFVVGSGGSGAP